MAKKAFGSMVEIFKHLSMTMKIGKRNLNYFVLSKLLYGFETLTIKMDLRKKLDAVEMGF